MPGATVKNLGGSALAELPPALPPARSPAETQRMSVRRRVMDFIFPMVHRETPAAGF